MLDSMEPLGALAQAEDRVNTLAKSAQDHEAKLPGEPIATELPVALGLKHSQTVLGTTQSAALNPTAAADSNAIRTTAGGVGTVAAWSEPALALSAPGGVAWVTPQSIQLFANHNLSHVALDIETGAQTNLQTITHGGTVLFTYGKADTSGATRPVSSTGIDLHAATGKARMRADSGAMAMHAQKSVTISSQTKIKADTPQKILLTAGGSAITIKGGQILLQAGGAINLKGNTKSYTGPASA